MLALAVLGNLVHSTYCKIRGMQCCPSPGSIAPTEKPQQACLSFRLRCLDQLLLVSVPLARSAFSRSHMKELAGSQVSSFQYCT